MRVLIAEDGAAERLLLQLAVEGLGHADATGTSVRGDDSVTPGALLNRTIRQ